MQTFDLIFQKEAESGIFLKNLFTALSQDEENIFCYVYFYFE